LLLPDTEADFVFLSLVDDESLDELLGEGDGDLLEEEVLLTLALDNCLPPLVEEDGD
jgi:hypothetical protein